MMERRLNGVNLHYSDWHRKIGDNCCMLDIDSVEFDTKTGKILATFETKFGLINEFDCNSVKNKVIQNITPVGVPAYLLIYYPVDINGEPLGYEKDYTKLAHIQFKIMGLNNIGRIKFPKLTRLTELELAEFINNLHGGKLENSESYSNKFINAFDKSVLIYPEVVESQIRIKTI